MSDFSAARLRAEVPGLDGIVFFNAASMGSPPRVALDAVADRLTLLGRGPAGRGWGEYVEDFERGVGAAKAEAARMIGAAPEEIALTTDTTSGLQHAMQAIPFRAGDNLVLSDLEYPNVGLAAVDAARSDGIEVRWVPNRGGRVTADDYRAAVDGKTRAIVASSVGWVTGERVDLAALSAIARERDAFLVVDAVQQLGAIPLDVSSLAIDFLATGAYKWLNAPFGVGFFYASRRVHERGLRVRRLGLSGLGPPAEGWGRFFESPDVVPVPKLDLSRTALRFDPQGTPPRLGATGLAAALAWRNAVDSRAAEAHVLGLSGELMRELDARGIPTCTPRADAERAGIVTFSLDGDARTDRHLRKFLEDRSIFTTARYCSGIGGVRAAVHVYTTNEELRALIAAIDEFRKS